jgi:ribosomal protein S18 acetylase RimI-like enzyme
MLRAFEISDTHLLNEWTGNAYDLFQFSVPLWSYPLAEIELDVYVSEYPNRQLFIYEAEGKAIGFGELIEGEKDAPRLSRLIIAPAYRGQGHGRQMMQEIESKCEADSILLFVLENNSMARSSYEKSGYEYVDMEPFSMEFNNEPYPVLKMRKTL